jgi:glucuronokinase
MIIRTHTYARIALMGNPSDGYNGKTIASAITNFKADVTLWESPTLKIIPNPVHDPTEFASLAVLDERATQYGYEDGVRLLLASCKKFNEYCGSHNIELEDKNFTISYDTNIPRQVGLGGSSAIITAVIRALMKFYGVTEADIPKPMLPNLILSVETEELEINAGLQDRVIQVYGGTVFMDFAKDLMDSQGHGDYEYLDSSLMPPLFLAHIDEPSHSGKIHSNVRYRYEQGDSEVVDAMKTFAGYARECKTAMFQKDYDKIHQLMNRNFDLRRKIFGDEVIGEKNLAMVAIARSQGCPAKFSGSGGTIIGMYRNPEQLQRLAEIYREHGFHFAEVSIDKGN